MSNTTVSDLYGLVRAAIGDRGVRDANGSVIANSNDYHDDDIKMAIAYSLLDINGYSSASDDAEITPEIVNDNDKGAIITYAALTLVLPEGGFSWDTPNMRYWSEANKELIAHLLGRLNRHIADGSVVPATWGALETLYNETQLVADRITASIGAY